MRLKSVPFHAVLLASASILAISPVWAADAAKTAPKPQAQAPAEASGGGSDEKVTVTARRVEERLQDTPVAVSAFSEKQLERLGAENIGAIQNSVPNLNLVQGRGSNSSANIFIRGVGQPDALATFDPAVGVYVDDVYISRIRGALFDVYDTARIEVLRGPQGTLYGKNTIGGALKVVTLKPSEEFSGRLFASFGTDNLMEFRARASGGLTDTLRAGISLYSADRDGFVTDPATGLDYNDKDTKAGRVSLYWDPDDKTEVRLNLDYTKENPLITLGKAENGVRNAFAAVLAPVTGPSYSFQTRTSMTLQRDENSLDHYGFGLTFTRELSSAWTLKSITAMRKLDYTDFIDIDATEFRVGDVLVDVNQNQQSQEFQFVYNGGGALRGVGGLYYLRERIFSHQEAYAQDFFPGFVRFIDDDQTMNSFAAFASVDYDVTPEVTVTAGARYTQENKKYDRITTTIGLVTAFDAPQEKKSYNDLSPSLTVTWNPGEDATYYAKVSKGFKSGGFNGRANSALELPRNFEPESLWSYEAGAKYSWLDGRLIMNSAFFYNTYKDFQARVARGSGLTSVFSVINAGELEQYGAEFEVFYRPIDELQLQAQLGWLEASYAEFFDPRFAPDTNPLNDRSWNTPAFSPDLTFRLGAVYTVDLDDAGNLDIGGDAAYRGDTALAVDNADFVTRVPFPGMHQEAYWLFNARIAWTSEDGRFTVAGIGKNLGDEVYRVDAQEFSSLGGIRTSYFGAPRTYQVVVAVNF
jgi:iron complex outermembrane receptor protein